jgi:hypothetical protein
VPSLGSICAGIDELARLNLSVVENLETALLEILVRPTHFAHILKAVCDRFDITRNCGQYALVGSTIRSFLSYLYNEDRLTLFFDANVLYWASAS